MTRFVASVSKRLLLTKWLQVNVVALLTVAGMPEERLRNMCDRIDDLYGGGTKPCLLAMLQAGTGCDLVHAQVKAALVA